MSRPATNEQVPFKLMQMPCCNHQVCWINPRLPTYCPECGTAVYMKLKSGAFTLDERTGWLRLEAKV